MPDENEIKLRAAALKMRSYSSSRRGTGRDTGNDSQSSKKKMSSVSNVLSQVMSKYGLDRRLKQQVLMSLWSQMVGEPFASLSRPVFVDYEGNLVIAVKDSAVAQELGFRKLELLRNLGPISRSLSVPIKGIRFDLKNFKEQTTERAASLEAREKRLIDPSNSEIDQLALTSAEEAELAEFAATLSVLASEAKADQSEYISYRSRMLKIYERELKLRAWRRENGCPSCSRCNSYELRLHGPDALCKVCFAESASGRTVKKLQD